MRINEKYDYKKLMLTIANSYNLKNNDEILVDYGQKDSRSQTCQVRFRLTKCSYKDIKRKESTQRGDLQIDFVQNDRMGLENLGSQHTPAPNRYNVAEQFHALTRKTPIKIHERIRYQDDNNPCLSPQTYQLNPEITRFGRKPHFYTRVYWDDDSTEQ